MCGPRRRLGVLSGFSEICTPEGQENYGFPALFFCHLGVFLPFPDFCSLFLPITGCKAGAKGNKNEEFFRKRPICPSTARNSFGILLLEGNKKLEITKKRPVATIHKLVRLSRECSGGRPARSRPLHANLLVVAGRLFAGGRLGRGRCTQICWSWPGGYWRVTGRIIAVSVFAAQKVADDSFAEYNSYQAKHFRKHGENHGGRI